MPTEVNKIACFNANLQRSRCVEVATIRGFTVVTLLRRHIIISLLELKDNLYISLASINT